MPLERVSDPTDTDEEATSSDWQTHRAQRLGERADDVRLEGPGTLRGVAAALPVNTRSSQPPAACPHNLQPALVFE